MVIIVQVVGVSLTFGEIAIFWSVLKIENFTIDFPKLTNMLLFSTCLNFLSLSGNIV